MYIPPNTQNIIEKIKCCKNSLFIDRVGSIGQGVVLGHNVGEFAKNVQHHW